MNLNVDAVLAFAGLVFVLSMSGLGALVWQEKHDERVLRRVLERHRR